MLTTQKSKKNHAPTVLRRMRESSGLTMRAAGAIIGISHVAISQFENEKMAMPGYRIEQMVRTYGFTMEEFNNAIGRPVVVNLHDDCHAMIDRMDSDQLTAIRAVMVQMLRPVEATQGDNLEVGA